MPPATRRPASRATRGTVGVSWEAVELAPVLLVSGSEGLLADRAVDRVVALARAADPGVEVTRIDAADYTVGTLGVVSSPSLFAEDKVLVIDGLERAGDDLLSDVTGYLVAPPADVVLVLRHAGGQRGKKLLDALRASGVPTVACDVIKSDGDKSAFVTAELRRAGRRADAQAVRALVDAVGSDLRELASSCAQLVADTTGLIGPDVVERYYGGRIEATGFRVADAAVAGQTGQAVSLLRHALATGVDPVPIVAALAAKLRVLAKVAAVRGRGAGAVRDLGLAPWQTDRAMSELRRWTPEGLASAISAVAQADAEVKGEGRDPQFAVERAVLRVAGAVGS
ncbi:DNA polymerase III subunit delta [Cellulomonas sp. Root137]|uniref:DNA polymerase III subunit delta n=1 Tax=Cellulomonas sp. Root137 TaxID=1736459 RepID=UPI0006FF73CC|nr:DNA polymerase III subunit delta [Cellulomonas sp. Root137]KQY48260.1 DNA polymerase III subunit delta [Cellulomonas sp. Root137]KRD45768.1 DNA polymerase III subunit delta [Cellulomonas sp. Root930]